eukprot:631389-Pyramimonas_sp.AAC.1
MALERENRHWPVKLAKSLSAARFESRCARPVEPAGHLTRAPEVEDRAQGSSPLGLNAHAVSYS